jgi:integrase/recombinase XerD
MLYETAARSSEVLALDIEDLDRRNRRSKVTRKGAAVDIIVWQTGTARLLPRLLDGRTRGPVFLTDRKARVALASADTDPVSGRARLSYRRAEEIFTDLTRSLAHPDITDPALLAAAPGWTLHQLRHSALTRAAAAPWPPAG